MLLAHYEWQIFLHVCPLELQLNAISSGDFPDGLSLPRTHRVIFYHCTCHFPPNLVNPLTVRVLRIILLSTTHQAPRGQGLYSVPKSSWSTVRTTQSTHEVSAEWVKGCVKQLKYLKIYLEKKLLKWSFMATFEIVLCTFMIIKDLFCVPIKTNPGSQGNELHQCSPRASPPSLDHRSLKTVNRVSRQKPSPAHGGDPSVVGCRLSPSLDVGLQHLLGSF